MRKDIFYAFTMVIFTLPIVSVQYMCGEFLGSELGGEMQVHLLIYVWSPYWFYVNERPAWCLMPPEPCSALPDLCPGKLFSMYLPDSFISWFLVQFGQWESSAREWQEDGEITCSPSHHASVTPAWPPWLGSALRCLWQHICPSRFREGTRFPPGLVSGASPLPVAPLALLTPQKESIY